MTASTPDQALLRGKAVDQLVEDGTITSAAVETAMRSVPRHLFIPEASPQQAYDPFRAFVTKRDGDGNSLSSVSDMHVMAWMLEQAGVEPGMNVLEIGAGGCNAALLSELAGPAGQVTTIDLDADVTARAARLLGEAGYPRVRVLLRDAGHGVPEHAPYDRILVTFGSWDVPPAWREELAADGRLVMPLRMLGLQRVLAVRGQGGHLASTASKMFGFVAAQGAGAHGSRLVVLPGGVTLRFDDETGIDPEPLARVLATPRAEEWTGTVIGNVPWHYDTQQVWAATALPGFCQLQAGDDSPITVAAPKKPGFAHAVVRGPDLAYILTRPAAADDGSRGAEFGVHAFGPGAADLASDVAGNIRTWAADYRDGPRPEYRIYPAGTPDAEMVLPSGRSRVIDKPLSRIAISWAAPESTAAPGRGSASRQTTG